MNLRDLDLTGNGIGSVGFLADLENLETLWLAFNKIVDLTGLSECSFEHMEALSLQHNWVNENTKLSDITGLPAMPNLEYLNLVNNAIVSLAPLPDLPNVWALSLWQNQIAEVDRLMTLEGITAGDIVDLYYNPLSEKALCLDIPKLVARGVEVDHEYPCGLPQDPTTDTTTDSDSDGFTNLDEWSYVGLYAVDPDQRRQMWLEFIFEPDLSPPGDPEDFEDWMACATVNVALEIEGEGTVSTDLRFPDTGTGDPYILDEGTYELAKFEYGCTDPCAVARSCDYNGVTLTATPAEGWVFDYWEGNLGANVGRWENPLHLELGGDRTVGARFLYRPTIAALDLVSDLTYFLTFIGETATVETFDRNEVEYDPDNGMSRLYVGNGMPDAAELYLLQAILEERGLDLSARGGVVNDAVWAAWSANVTRAQTDLPGQDARIVRTVAAYMTLGDFGSAATIEDMVESHISGASVDPANYDNSQRSFLAAGEDADNDGATNLEEWQAASPGGGLANLAAFASAATDGDDGPGSSGGQGESCPNEACLDTGEMEVRTADFFSPGASATVTATPVGSGIVFGTEMSVSVEPNASNGTGFLCWIAPDSMIDGSRARKESGWLLMDDTEAVAMIERGRLFLPDDNSSYSITVTCNDGAIETVDGEGNRVVVGPPGASATLTAVSNSSLRVIGWQWEGTRFSYSDSVTLPLGGHADPIMSSQPLTGKKSISVSASQGGTAMAAAISVDWDGCFLGSIEALQASKVSFSANPSPGWEFDYWEGYPGLGPLLHNWDASGVSSMRAVFRKKVEYTLSLGLGGDDAPCSGYITVDDPKKYYSQDEEVTLTANPAPGYVFLFWDGLSPCSDDPPANSNPLYLTMHRSRSVTAVFDLDPVILMQGSRRILETAGDVDEDGIQDNMATISAAPAMPQLVASLRNGGSGVDVSWSLTVTYQRPDAGSETRTYAGTGSPWTVDFGEDFIGGNAVLTVWFCDLGPVPLSFEIRGYNPALSVARDYIHERVPYWYIVGIVQQESQHRQFVAPPGLPVFGAPHGFGIMQIDPPDNVNQIFNWHLNVEEGVDRHTEKRNMATDWMTSQQSQQESENQSASLANEQFNFGGYIFALNTNRTPVDACTIQAYNGAALWCIYWENRRPLDPENYPGRWCRRDSGYVVAVCQLSE